jgi:hypothetical protein
MKEELTLKVVEILTSMQSAVGKAGDFAMEQLPDIAQSYVIYGRVQSVVMLLSSLLCIAGFAFMTHWLVKNPWKGEFGESRGMTNTGSIVICAVFVIIFIFAASDHISSSLLVWLAPKVWLLKEIATLIK